MSKTEIMAKLSVSLTECIDGWLEKQAGTKNWEDLDSYVGEDLCHLMSKAAMAVLESSVDVQNYLKRERLL